MESYIFGNKKDIYKNKIEYLIFLKNLLARYYNSIPDSLAVTLFKESKKSKKIIVETGVGASTVALFLSAVFHKKKIISFDKDKKKTRFIKKFITSNICNYLDVDINKYLQIKNVNTKYLKNWKSNLNIKSNFFFLDSCHDLSHIYKEIDNLQYISDKKLFIIFDDMNFDLEEKNLKYLEMRNFKLKKTILNIQKLKFKPKRILKQAILNYLNNNFKKLKIKKSYFDQNYKNDMYTKIYGSDYFYNQISEIRSRSLNKKKLNDFLKNRLLYVELTKY